MQRSLARISCSVRDVGKTPGHFGIAAFQRRCEQCRRVLRAARFEIDLREVHPRLHVARQIVDRGAVPHRSPFRIGRRHALAPQHAELKRRPRGSERRYVRIAAQRLDIRAIGLLEFAEIREQRTERDPLLPMAGSRHAFAPRRQHRGKMRPRGLIDRQREALGRVHRRAAGCRLRKAFSRLRESMRRTRDLRCNRARCARIPARPERARARASRGGRRRQGRR